MAADRPRAAMSRILCGDARRWQALWLPPKANGPGTQRELEAIPPAKSAEGPASFAGALYRGPTELLGGCAIDEARLDATPDSLVLLPVLAVVFRFDKPPC
jgi:hypothetical protein